jgi:hypothetical protein
MRRPPGSGKAEILRGTRVAADPRFGIVNGEVQGVRTSPPLTSMCMLTRAIRRILRDSRTLLALPPSAIFGCLYLVFGALPYLQFGAVPTGGARLRWDSVAI